MYSYARQCILLLGARMKIIRPQRSTKHRSEIVSCTKHQRIRRWLQKWQVTTRVKNATDHRASSATVTGASRRARYESALFWSTLHLVRTTLYPQDASAHVRGPLPTRKFIQPLSPNLASITQSNYAHAEMDLMKNYNRKMKWPKMAPVNRDR